MSTPRNPYPTVDVIIEVDGPDGAGIVLIERKNEPHGWAIPGGFVVELTALLGVYSAPDRDPRFHTMSAVYVGRASGTPRAADDAGALGVFTLDALPPLVFDHAQILADYARFKATGQRPAPAPAT
jgi:8-oxo-dGTP diphosphatase